MSTPDVSSRTPQQWAKLALIPALILVLLVVLCWPAQDEAGAGGEPVALSPGAANPSSGKQPDAARSKWPKARLEDLLALNPFEPPQAPQSAETLPEANAAREVSSEEPAQPPAIPIGKLQAVYFDAHGAAAILDSKVIRVGDTLPNGKRVVEITSRGIKLEGLQ
jgi:hypothetical protein